MQRDNGTHSQKGLRERGCERQVPASCASKRARLCEYELAVLEYFESSVLAGVVDMLDGADAVAHEDHSGRWSRRPRRAKRATDAKSG